MSALEKAARALNARAGYTEYGPVIPELLAPDLVRAVLMAVREPTTEMLQPACAKHTPGQPMSERSPHECPGFVNGRKRWISMIDAILNEETLA